ncbi:hydantoinase/oxoprolinase family protein [Yaniella flava]|uniref:Hydantoinase/oxoprolinase family protein n=2 Tax=Yaniella flava TaxID=287930 RepID=A0ABP5FP87_9MICC
MLHMSQSGDPLHMAVDTGGTFTDVAVRGAGGKMFVWKLPSTPTAPDEAVIDGVKGALARVERSPQELTRFVHGSTVATNTVITRDGARVGMVTTAGFRDVLAIAHQARPSIYDQHKRRPEPLIARQAIIEATERIDADGQILTALDETALEVAIQQLAPLELDAIVVSLINAYANPAHEHRVTEIVQQSGVAEHVVAATNISAEMREYERTSTAAINAYVAPKIAGYIAQLEQGLTQAGVQTGMRIMQSSGGLLSPGDAAEHPARTVLSGLAGGVVGAANWSTHLDLDRVVSFDIGGTSTDIALIRDGIPDETLSTEIAGLPLKLPSVDVHTIGAGGGSIAWLDSGGGLRVGPHSAGAEPGPISYQRGGTEPTVTDAHAVLGRLGDELLGGEFSLDVPAARDAMHEWGQELGLSAEDTAEGILRVITATMARGIRKVSVERGVDLRTCDLMAFGGAGPLHGADLAKELNMRSAIIPPRPGIASAVGMLDAPIRHDYATSVDVSTTEALVALGDTFATMRTQADSDLDNPEAETQYELLVDARYIGQSYELTVAWDEDWGRQREIFEDAHEQNYGFADPDAVMEIVVARLVVTQELEHGALESVESIDADVSPTSHREVYIAGAWQDLPIFQRTDFGAQTKVEGPAIIEQFDSTIYLGPDQVAHNDTYDFLHIHQAT